MMMRQQRQITESLYNQRHSDSKLLYLVMVSVLIFYISGCADIKRIANSLTNISKLEFSLDGVTGMSVEGVRLDRIKSLKDLSVLDGLKLANAYKNKTLNTSFIINVLAENPNGLESGQKNISATIEDLQWDLYIDDIKTISGGLASPVKVPGGGGSEIIPLRIDLNLVDYFQNRGYDALINLVLNIGGLKSDPSVIRLSAKPTVGTSFGPIAYPGTIDIEHEIAGN